MVPPYPYNTYITHADNFISKLRTASVISEKVNNEYRVKVNIVEYIYIYIVEIRYVFRVQQKGHPPSLAAAPRRCHVAVYIYRKQE